MAAYSPPRLSPRVSHPARAIGLLAAVSASAFFIAPAPAAGQSDAVSSRQALIDTIDENGDGVVDAAEYTTALRAYLALADENQDGWLDMTDVNPEDVGRVTMMIRFVGRNDTDRDRKLSGEEIDSFIQSRFDYFSDESGVIPANRIRGSLGRLPAPPPSAR